MDTYFTKFPLVEYNNRSVLDISRNVRLKNDIRKNASLFYPYELTAGLRADMLAYSYYNDAHEDYLIYLTNGIVDPYYGWYLSENEFNDFIVSKYGTFEKAVTTIRHWALSWGDIDEEIPTSFYNNNLPNVLKKYYLPRFGYSANILSFVRKPADWTVNTNRILTATGTMNGNATFSTNDAVTFVSGGKGTLVWANTTQFMIQHIQGNCSPSVLTANGGANANVTSVSTTAVNISLDEEIYWKPVTYFEWETNRNEEKKSIYLMDANFALEASEDIRKKLRE